jgi:D-glycero-D-manno-heptose 1,7-bisphosphate phosphatase
MSPLRALLLDRDGTLIKERNYLCDPAGVALIPGAGEALARLGRQGVRLFMVSNQSGIGRGYFPAEACLEVNAEVASRLEAFGAHLADNVFCPHAPDAGCGCRKPAPGMWEILAAKHGLSPETSAMVGDTAADVAFARGCGLAAAVLVLTGHGRQSAAELGLPLPETGWIAIENPTAGQPQAVALDLPSAVEYLEKVNREKNPS